MNKLTNETLFDAIGELDEDLIAEARETEAAPAKKASRVISISLTASGAPFPMMCVLAASD